MEAYIAVGSNLAPERHVPLALRALVESYGALVLSPVYRLPAVGFLGPAFWNLAVRLTTLQTPQQLAQALRSLEYALGRSPQAQKCQSRTIDLDILLCDDQVGQFGDLILPRPGFQTQVYVMAPLVDIAPDALHPTTGLSLRAHWQAMPASLSPPQALPFSLDALLAMAEAPQ